MNIAGDEDRRERLLALRRDPAHRQCRLLAAGDVPGGRPRHPRAVRSARHWALRSRPSIPAWSRPTPPGTSRRSRSWKPHRHDTATGAGPARSLPTRPSRRRRSPGAPSTATARRCSRPRLAATACARRGRQSPRRATSSDGPSSSRTLQVDATYEFTLDATDVCGYGQPTVRLVRLNDTTPPSAPIVATPAFDPAARTVSLQWVASTDNIQVDHYEILRNGVPVGATDAPSFTDSSPRQHAAAELRRARRRHQRQRDRLCARDGLHARLDAADGAGAERSCARERPQCCAGQPQPTTSASSPTTYCATAPWSRP